MTTSTLKKTAVASGILGLALVAFLKTKKGVEIKKQIKNNLDDLYENVGQKLQGLGDTTKEKYDEIVATLVREYAQKKMLATEIAIDLTRELQNKWLTFQLYYLYGKVKSKMNSANQASKSQFESTADEIVREYGKNKNLAKAEVIKLTETVKSKWKDFKEELSAQDSSLT